MQSAINGLLGDPDRAKVLGANGELRARTFTGSAARQIEAAYREAAA